MTEFLVVSIVLVAFVFSILRAHAKRIQKLEEEISSLKTWASKPKFFGSKKDV